MLIKQMFKHSKTEESGKIIFLLCEVVMAKYHEIYMAISRDIDNKILTPGDLLPTEQEYAEKYNVSITTVRHALDMLVNENKITRTAGKGSFVKDSQIITEKKKIGLVMPTSSEFFGRKISKGIQSFCKENNLIPIISSTYKTQSEEAEELQYMLSLGISGIIIMPMNGELYNSAFTSESLQNMPLVMVDRYLPGLPYTYVCTDNFNASKDLVNYLFAKGHSKIAFIGSFISNTALEERIKGFMYAFAHSEDRAYHEKYVCRKLNSSDTNQLYDNIAMLTDLFTTYNEITAAVAENYECANLIQLALKMCGKDLSNFEIVCFDGGTNSALELLNGSFYTHILQDEYTIGYKAAELLLQQINNPKESIPHVTVPYQLIKKEDVEQTVSAFLKNGELK